MLTVLKESILVKKIYVGIIMFLGLLILIAIISPNPNAKNVFIGSILMILILSYLSKFINIREWIRDNSNIPIYYSKVTLYFFGCLIIGLMGYIDYAQVFSNMLMLSGMFLFGLFTFHCLTKEQKNSEVILASLKIFFSVFVLMTIMIYNTYKDAISLENELHKSEIEYALPKDKLEKLNNYNTFIESQLKLFTPEKIDFNKKYNTNEDKKVKKEPEFHIFMNIASSVIILTIIYCCVLIINNLGRNENN